MSKRWYVVQAYSGFEKNVQKTLKERIARENMDKNKPFFFLGNCATMMPFFVFGICAEIRRLLLCLL